MHNPSTSVTQKFTEVKKLVKRKTTERLKDEVFAAVAYKKSNKRTKSTLKGDEADAFGRKKSSTLKMARPLVSKPPITSSGKNKIMNSTNPFSALKSTDSVLYKELLR